MEEALSKAAAARADAVAKDQELRQQVTRVSALELETGALKMEVQEISAEKETLKGECESLRIQKESVESLMAAAQAAQVDAQSDLNWLMSAGIQGVSVCSFSYLFIISIVVNIF